MEEPTLPLAGLSPFLGKQMMARFDGGMLSSDAGILVLREVEKRVGVAERLSGCIDDPWMPEQAVHSLADMIGFRLMMIAADYEDGNDASSLRSDPAFKLAQDRLPSGRDLASQPTISRLENLPDIRSLLRMGQALVDLYYAFFRQAPGQIVLDIDDTFDAVHGSQQLRLFNAHYDEYGFQPIVVFDGDGRIVTAMLRPAKRPKGTEIHTFLRRLLRAIRASWPSTRILIRADSHYCCPEVIDFCRTNGLDKATANQFRLAGACWLMWGLRMAMPKRSTWRVAQFDTLRLRLIKIAAKVVEMKTQIRLQLCRLVGRRYSDVVSAFSTSGVGQAPVQEIAGLSCG